MQRSATTLLLVAALGAGCQWGQQEKKSEARLSDAAGPAEAAAEQPQEAELQEPAAAEEPGNTQEARQASPPRAARQARSEPARVPEPAPARAEAPRTPEPTPTPLPPIEIPAGTRIPVTLKSAVSSEKSQAGDRVVATVTSDIVIDGRTAIGSGSDLHGRVTAAVGAGRVKGRARLAFTFDELVVRGKPHDISVRPIDITAASEKKKDAAVVGGGAGIGAVVGAIAGGKKGAAIGAAVGAGAGGGAVMATKGKEVEMAPGHNLKLTLTETLVLR